MTVPEEQDPLINTVLGGARIQRRVSAGLLAHVYLGHYEGLNVPVAVKVLSPKATAQGLNKERFIREGRALAQLSHPNILKIYNVGHDNGRYFIVMDWIQDGMNLRQLAQSRPLTPAQSLKVARRLSEALDYIHQKQLIHRDLKPANVCLRKGGHPVLMDFSLIKDTSSDVQLTAPGTIMGTVNFMPPEQAQPGGPFGNVGPWSDVYSLGGTLYWLLTGRPPFKGRTPMETIIKLIREPHVPPSQINPSIPPEVDELVARSLAKKSEERFQSAREFAAAIDHLMVASADALARGTPPPPASEDDAGSPATPPSSGSGVIPPGTVQAANAAAGPATRNWGSVARSSSGVQPAIPQPAPVAAPAPPPQAVPAAARATNRLGSSQTGAPGAPPSPRGSGRLAPGPSPSTEGWSPAQAPAAAPPAELPIEEVQTVRIHGGAPRPPFPGAPPDGAPAAARQSSGERVMPKPQPPSDLRRSWVEDAPTAPSWTEQQKDPNASVLGMRRTPGGTAPPEDAPPSPEPSEPAAPRHDPPADRATKPAAAPRKGKRSGAEVFLVAGLILLIVTCIGLAVWVLFFKGGSP